MKYIVDERNHGNFDFDLIFYKKIANDSKVNREKTKYLLTLTETGAFRRFVGPSLGR